MHKLEITGTTPEHLLTNLLQMATMLLNGGVAPTPAIEAKQSEPEEITLSDGTMVAATTLASLEIPLPAVADAASLHERIVAGEMITATSGSAGETAVECVRRTEKEVGAAPPKKRGKGKNSESPIVDMPTEKTVELNDDISDVGSADVKRFPPGYLASGQDGPAKFLTLNDDIKPRLQAIQKACVARGLDMPATVAYILKLYGPFGIAKADQLKPEQFAEFMEASEAYLSGEA